MAKIIDNSQLSQHKIERFSFGVFQATQSQKYDPKQFDQNLDEPNESLGTNKSDIKTKENADELLKKIEQLTEENLSLQMKLEDFEKNFQQKIEAEKELAYQKGRDDITKELQDEAHDEIESLKSQLINSITKLDESAMSHENSLETLKDELVDLSLSISQKVIKNELSTNSKNLAFNLTKEFIKKIKDATSILIKANPTDAIYLKEKLKEIKKIKIEGDDAINKGGIIILSDLGNFDATIDARIKRVVDIIKKEG